jgi:hypothetical protein
MSALGQKRTCAVQNVMSAFGSLADIPSMSLLRVKRTWLRKAVMSAFDPKRIFVATAAITIAKRPRRSR